MSNIVPSPVLLESTDLGPDAEKHFTGWLQGKVPARAISVWVAHKVEKSPRLRIEIEQRNNRDILDLLSGSAFAHAKKSEFIFEAVFGHDIADVIEAAYKYVGICVPNRAAELDVGKTNTLFRRLSLRSRWATAAVSEDPRSSADGEIDLVKLHIYMEVIRWHHSGLSVVRRSSVHMSDPFLQREISWDASQIEKDSVGKSQAELVAINLFVEEYLLSIMKLKASLSELVSRQRENSVYETLGVSESSTDAEIKKAYRSLAMQLHPDKGGDKELFQQLTEAYEKILAMRGITRTTDIPEGEESVPPFFEPKPKPDPDPDPSPCIDVLGRLVKAADECVRNARSASDLTSKALGMISSQKNEFTAIFIMVMKCVRVCGYASLDASSLALEAVRDSKSSECEIISADLMNLGFDAVNATCEFRDIMASNLETLIATLSQVTAKAVACASQITRLAKTVDFYIRKPPSMSMTTPPSPQPITEESQKRQLIRQRIQNSQILGKINAEIIQDEQFIFTKQNMSYSNQPNPFLRSAFQDWTRCCVSQTEQLVRADVLIRSVDLVVDTFKDTLGLNESKGLAISSNPLVGLWKYEIRADRAFSLPFIATEIVIPLACLAACRNKFRSPSDIASEVWKALELDLMQGNGQLSLDV